MAHLSDHGTTDRIGDGCIDTDKIKLHFLPLYNTPDFNVAFVSESCQVERI
jgi:hypothetical protein